jgi:peptidoglycan/LPS O-acetylase OafA/YrhL
VKKHDEAGSEPRLTQLDGLRALAALAVIVYHYPPFPLGNHIDLGAAGVRMFFVLSGFLITGILLRARGAADDRPEKLRQLGIFYARRSLRIFPLYYATLLGVALMDHRVRGYLPWYLTYMTNFAVIRDGQGSLPLGYFWTLAIEEQFYLVWPTLILFAPRRWLPVLLGLVAASGPVSRATLWSLTGNYYAAVFATPSTLDSLGLGAVLAWLSFSPGRAARRRTFRVACLVVGLVLYLAGEIWRPQLAIGARFALSILGMNLVFAWVVDRAACGFRGPAGAVLGGRLIGYVGTISYALYVFHPLVLRLAGVAIAAVLRRPVDFDVLPAPLRFLLALALSFVAASASWFLFERPINDLKRFFAYARTRPKDVLPSAIAVAPSMSDRPRADIPSAVHEPSGA